MCGGLVGGREGAGFFLVFLIAATAATYLSFISHPPTPILTILALPCTLCIFFFLSMPIFGCGLRARVMLRAGC